MPLQRNSFVLPPDYTFTPGGLLIHKASYERLAKLVNQARNRDPDRFDMHVYNDFFGYAILELVDKTLSSIRTHVQKKQWLDAWRALDALSKFSDMFDAWTNVDDGDRVRATEKVFGALLVHTIRALDASSQFIEQTIPDLELSLTAMAQSAEALADDLDCCYHVVLKGYGKKLFGRRTNEERKHMTEALNAAFEAFVKALSPREREKEGYMVGDQASDADEDDEDEDDDESEQADGSKTWYGDARAKDADMKDPSFRIIPVWKEYKDYLSGCPRTPMRGPAVWDLTKWSAADKKQFSFDDDAPFGFEDDDY